MANAGRNEIHRRDYDGRSRIPARLGVAPQENGVETDRWNIEFGLLMFGGDGTVTAGTTHSYLEYIKCEVLYLIVKKPYPNRDHTSTAQGNC